MLDKHIKWEVNLCLYVSYNVTARSIISECNSVGQRMYDHQTMWKASLKERRLVFQYIGRNIYNNRAKHRSFRANHLRVNRLPDETTSFPSSSVVNASIVVHASVVFAHSSVRRCQFVSGIFRLPLTQGIFPIIFTLITNFN